jgi:radical SAM superfamily enzyme YgiQ (UPF0313 family)
MKITIVSPKFPYSAQVPMVPPILEYLAALTLRENLEIRTELIDANQADIENISLNTDLIAISTMTATAPWAYSFAESCRAKGIPVIMGGIHPTALPEEAALHADSVVVGEAESIWGELLADAKFGRLKQFYYGQRLPLEGLPMPVNSNLKGNYRFRAFFTMRGCPYRCIFCSVRRFFGDTIRYRPISEAVEEIESRAGRVWFNGDDNIWGGDVKRSTALFTELSLGTKKHWYGFGDLKAIQGSQGEIMLAAARKSGLFSVWVGWETDSHKSLRTLKASGKQGENRIEAIKRMQNFGIDVVLFVVLGGRQDSIDSFKKTLDLADTLNVGIHPVLLTPLPGTELYEEYRQHLIPALGWEYFTGVNAVFQHPDIEMTPKRREEEYHKLCQELFRYERIIKRISKIPLSGLPSTHFLSLMKQLPMKKALKKAYQEWVAENTQ